MPDTITKGDFMANKKKVIHIKEPRQPKKCKGCVWGRWDGVKQFCSRPVCQKGISILLKNSLYRGDINGR